MVALRCTVLNIADSKSLSRQTNWSELGVSSVMVEGEVEMDEEANSKESILCPPMDFSEEDFTRAAERLEEYAVTLRRWAAQSEENFGWATFSSSPSIFVLLCSSGCPPHGNVSPLSNVASVVLVYHPGKVHRGLPEC